MKKGAVRASAAVKPGLLGWVQAPSLQTPHPASVVVIVCFTSGTLRCISPAGWLGALRPWGNKCQAYQCAACDRCTAVQPRRAT